MSPTPQFLKSWVILEWFSSDQPPHVGVSTREGSLSWMVWGPLTFWQLDKSRKKSGPWKCIPKLENHAFNGFNQIKPETNNLTKKTVQVCSCIHSLRVIFPALPKNKHQLCPDAAAPFEGFQRFRIDKQTKKKKFPFTNVHLIWEKYMKLRSI